MKMKYRAIRSRGKQQGAVLVIGLLLLVVITILAISGMNTATTELAMARNDKYYENAFQAAEAGLEQALAQRPFSTLGPVDLGQYSAGDNENVSTIIDFIDSTPVPPGAPAFSLGSGIAAYHFVATARAESLRSPGSPTNRDSAATHTQAFYTIGPGSSAL